MIPYGRQSVDDEDIEAVVQVLKGEWLTQGPYVAEFEAALAQQVGARYAVAFTSGTAGLHAAAAVAQWGPGSRVATSPLSFVASANCARTVGASVEFVDIDPVTLNLDPEAVPSGLDGLIAVHYAGLPVDLERMRSRARIVIEDACHALGATTPDGPVGNCAQSDMCVFSFHPVKAITTGEGGAVTTNDDRLASGLRRFRNHGIVPKPERGGWYYEVESTGTNFRMTDIQAALGRSQLAKLERFIVRRRVLADRYQDRLAGLPVQVPPGGAEGVRHARHLYPVRVQDRARVFDGMRAGGIGVQVHYVPIYRHPVFGGHDGRLFPRTEAAYAQLLSLPLFPDLTDDEQDEVVERLAALVRSA